MSESQDAEEETFAEDRARRAAGEFGGLPEPPTERGSYIDGCRTCHAPWTECEC